MDAPEFYASVPATDMAHFVGRRILTRPTNGPDSEPMQWVKLSDTNMLFNRRQKWERYITAGFRWPRPEPLRIDDKTVSHDAYGFAHYSDTNWLMVELTAEEFAESVVVDLGSGYQIREWTPPATRAPEPETVPTPSGDQFTLL